MNFESELMSDKTPLFLVFFITLVSCTGDN